MRTLVISDLHLGNRRRRDVLRSAVAQERLLEAVNDADRLVLLGDLMELVTRRPGQSMAIAEPIMRAIGRRLGPEREVIVVPGNHDFPLIRRWAFAQGRDLGPTTDVPPAASPSLAQLLGWLEPARARVSYPGVWLGEGVWATHGHFIDRHLIPGSAYGIRRWRDPSRVPQSALPIDYESGRFPRRRSSSDGGRALPVGPTLKLGARALRVAANSSLPRKLLQAGLAQANARVIDTQMRHEAIPAIGQVVRCLGIDADWILFGHVHRRGPIGDEHWPADGEMRFLNTGSWLHESMLIDRAEPPHGYWPGGAVLLQDGRAPRSLGLLDDVDADLLRPPDPLTSGKGSPATGS